MSSKSLQELIAEKNYLFAVYKDKHKLAAFDNRYSAIAFADEHSFNKQKPQVNPNIIVPADVYEIRIIDENTKKTVSKEIYTANIRIRK